MTDIYYAGIGSRRTPSSVLNEMMRCAAMLAKLGLVLRSGEADGADIAFRRGADSVNGKLDIWLPWEGFNGYTRPANIGTPRHAEHASKYHPKWNHLSRGAQLLHGRNSGQILGKDLNTAVSFVLCWTSDGCEHHGTRSFRTGGTGMAISIASDCSIPVVNMFNPNYKDRLAVILSELPV